MKTIVFKLTATRSKALDVTSFELLNSVEDFGSPKTSGVGGLKIKMSVVCKYSFGKD